MEDVNKLISDDLLKSMIKRYVLATTLEKSLDYYKNLDKTLNALERDALETIIEAFSSYYTAFQPLLTTFQPVYNQLLNKPDAADDDDR